MNCKRSMSFLCFFPCAFLFLYLLTSSAACCCRESDPSLPPDLKDAPTGDPVDGLACSLILHQPVLISTATFSGEIRLKNISRNTIYIETPGLRGTQESCVCLEWGGRLLSCAVIADGLEAYPYDIIEIKPGRTVALEYTWKRNSGLEDGETYFWPEPGHHAIRARLMFPEPVGDILSLSSDRPAVRFFHGTITSNEVKAAIDPP